MELHQPVGCLALPANFHAVALQVHPGLAETAFLSQRVHPAWAETPYQNQTVLLVVLHYPERSLLRLFRNVHRSENLLVIQICRMGIGSYS
jgi:hypothetical protein